MAPCRHSPLPPKIRYLSAQQPSQKPHRSLRCNQGPVVLKIVSCCSFHKTRDALSCIPIYMHRCGSEGENEAVPDSAVGSSLPHGRTGWCCTDNSGCGLLSATDQHLRSDKLHTLSLTRHSHQHACHMSTTSLESKRGRRSNTIIDAVYGLHKVPIHLQVHNFCVVRVFRLLKQLGND